jgi:hypothetical protein
MAFQRTKHALNLHHVLNFYSILPTYTLDTVPGFLFSVSIRYDIFYICIVQVLFSYYHNIITTPNLNCCYADYNVIPFVTSFSKGTVHGYSGLFSILAQYIDNYDIYKVNNLVKVSIKDKLKKSYCHIAYFIHGNTRTLIKDQLLNMNIDDVFGVKLDSCFDRNEI